MNRKKEAGTIPYSLFPIPYAHQKTFTANAALCEQQALFTAVFMHLDHTLISVFLSYLCAFARQLLQVGGALWVAPLALCRGTRPPQWLTAQRTGSSLREI
ncbi:MAG: hypothetical protein QNJ63_29535 [Calothrix sp. MO_192.B10]|nr:hypothetical protein [Calothrix sp. MO_192.B10]